MPSVFSVVLFPAFDVAHQAPPFVDLPFVKFVPLAGKRIFTLPELEVNRRADEPQVFAKIVGEIALVGTGYGFDLVAVDHDSRWVLPAEMGESELDPPATHQWRLMRFRRLFEQTREVAGFGRNESRSPGRDNRRNRINPLLWRPNATS